MVGYVAMYPLPLRPRWCSREKEEEGDICGDEIF